VVFVQVGYVLLDIPIHEVSAEIMCVLNLRGYAIHVDGEVLVLRRFDVSLLRSLGELRELILDYIVIGVGDETINYNIIYNYLNLFKRPYAFRTYIFLALCRSSDVGGFVIVL
jgi:hypothetical protein